MDQLEKERLERIYRRDKFQKGDVKYITHTQQRTFFFLEDGRKIMTTMPLKSVAACLSEDEFWSIQKGVLVSKYHIAEINDSGLYTMSDGQIFQGRSRNPAEHKRRRRELECLERGTQTRPLSMYEQCRIMEDAPVAFSVIELIFSKDGRGIDFIFRYCNREMERLEGVPVENMLNRSFYEVFPNGDRKWIVPYADVAINGTKRVIHKYSPEAGKNLAINCFQPKSGFCACLLTEEPADHDSE